MRLALALLKRFKYVIPFTFIGHALYTRHKCEEDSGIQEELETTVSKIFFSIQQAEFSDLKLFSIGSQNLGREIASHLDISLGRHQTTKFSDGEINMQIYDSVSGHKVVILKTFDNQSINDGLMELILAVSAMKKNGAAHVTAIIPYFPYTINPIDQNAYEQIYHSHHPYASDVARMIQSSGCDTIVTLNSQINELKGFTGKECNIISLDCTELTVPYLIYKNISKPVLIGSRPHPAISKRLKQLGDAFNIFDVDCGFGLFSSQVYVGDNVKDRDVILFTNVIRSGQRLAMMAEDLKQRGAKNIYVVGIHGTNKSPEFVKLINDLPINELIVTNTFTTEYQSKKIRCLSVGKYLAEVISLINKGISLHLFRNERDVLKYFYLQKIRKAKQYKQGIESPREPAKIN